MLAIILSYAWALAVGFFAGLVLDHATRDDPPAPPSPPHEPRARVANNGRAYLEKAP